MDPKFEINRLLRLDGVLGVLVQPIDNPRGESQFEGDLPVSDTIDATTAAMCKLVEILRETKQESARMWIDSLIVRGNLESAAIVGWRLEAIGEIVVVVFAKGDPVVKSLVRAVRNGARSAYRKLHPEESKTVAVGPAVTPRPCPIHRPVVPQADPAEAADEPAFGGTRML